jgi:8-oxo-dGTP pyrophosphatase MutT (NUDIX family)
MDPIPLAGCVIIQDGKLLLLWKSKRRHYEFPGGKVERGETMEEAAKRESKEEIGCDVDILSYDGYADFQIEGRLFRSHRFLAKVKEGQAPRVNEPEVFGNLLWMPLDDWRSYTLAPNVHMFCESRK